MNKIIQVSTGSNNVQSIIINGVNIKNMRYYRLETYESLMLPTYRSGFTNKLWWLKLKAKFYYWTKKCPIAIVTYDGDELVHYDWIREYSKNTSLETKNIKSLSDFEENRNDVNSIVAATNENSVEFKKLQILSDFTKIHEHENLLEMSDDEFYKS